MLIRDVELHVSGEFDVAGKLYHFVINLQLNHADANHSMDLLKLDIEQDQKRWLSYRQLLKPTKAISIDP